MIDSPEPLDYTPLIEALQAANKMETFNEQLAVIEMAILQTEFHPKADKFCEMLWSIEVMHGIDYSVRRWQPIEDKLNGFFAD
jgi:hypothetical protein